MTVRRIEVATGGNPAAALARAMAGAYVAGEVWSISVAHDDDCPCLAGRPITSCTCEVIGLTCTRIARARQ